MVLLFGASAEVTLWDGVVLADSLSLSLLAAFVASWLWLLSGWTAPRAGAVALAALLWACTKDTNAWAVLVVAVLVAAGIAARCLHWRYAVLAGVLVAVFILSDATASKAPRWVVAFMNTVALRILPSSDNTAYFASLGMPVSPALLRRTDRKAWLDDWAFFRDPELQPFRDWLYRHGKRTYVRFLLAHPASTLQDPLRHVEDLLSATALRNYAPAKFSGILPEPLAELVYFKKWWIAGVALAAVAAGLLLGARPWRRDAPALVPLALLLLVYPQIALAWHADPNEIERHGLEAAVTLRLGLWLSLVLGAASLRKKA